MCSLLVGQGGRVHIELPRLRVKFLILIALIALKKLNHNKLVLEESGFRSYRIVKVARVLILVVFIAQW